METYKCLNPNCGQVWQSNDEPFECPSCHETNFVNVKNNTNQGFFKKNWWVILVAVVVVAFIVFLLLRGNGGATQVGVTQDKKAGTITVTIKGSHENDYMIQLLKGGAEFQRVERVNTTTFSIISEGTYTLNVQYIGGGKAPEINQYQNVFTFEEIVSELDVEEDGELDKDQVTPQIVKIDFSPTTPSSKYTVTLNIDLKGDYAKNVEYAMDDGRWQDKNVFKDVNAGKHLFRARNKKNHAKENIKSLTLLKPYEETEVAGLTKDAKTDKSLTSSKTNNSDGVSKGNTGTTDDKGKGTKNSSKTGMSVSEINQLLDRVSKGDESASDKLTLTVGSNTKVTGVKYINNVFDLVTDAFTGNRYKVTGVTRDNDGNITSLTIKEN